MTKLQTALDMLRNEGPIEVAKKSLETLSRSIGVGVSFGSFRAIGGDREIGQEEDVNIFEKIYRANLWESEESRSGPGSEIAYTSDYRKKLSKFLIKDQISSLSMPLAAISTGSAR